MNWFWTTKEQTVREEDELNKLVQKNDKAIRDNISSSRKKKQSSDDLLRLSEDALKYLEGLEKKNDT